MGLFSKGPSPAGRRLGIAANGLPIHEMDVWGYITAGGSCAISGEPPAKALEADDLDKSRTASQDSLLATSPQRGGRDGTNDLVTGFDDRSGSSRTRRHAGHSIVANAQLAPR